MRKQQWHKIICTLFLTGFMLIPVQLYAEAEPLYVLGLDLEYIESNQFLSWIEEMRYKLSEISPLLKNILDPQNNLSDG
jgi:hypothetical protein